LAICALLLEKPLRGNCTGLKFIAHLFMAKYIESIVVINKGNCVYSNKYKKLFVALIQTCRSSFFSVLNKQSSERRISFESFYPLKAGWSRINLRLKALRTICGVLKAKKCFAGKKDGKRVRGREKEFCGRRAHKLSLPSGGE
jgi:hypothetical protein